MSFQLQNLVDSFAAPNLVELGENYFSYGISEAKKWRDLGDSEMSQIAKKITDGAPWDEAIYQFTASNKWVKNIALSPSRSLFLDLFDFTNVRHALDVGAGWGPLTLALSERAQNVIAVESTKERLDIIHAICKQTSRTNVGCLHGDIFNLPFQKDSFDFVLFCGVYEWLGNNGSTDDVKTLQEKALEIVFGLLRPRGRLVIAIENRLGLKYLLGERDDHSKERHLSYLPYHESEKRYAEERHLPLRSRTYDRREYETSLRQAGFSQVSFYLAFPDYKLPQLLAPANNLQALKKLVDNSLMPDEHDGCNGHPSENNEILKRIYRSLNNVEVVPDLTPSFIIVAEKNV